MNMEDTKVPPEVKLRGKDGILSHVLVDENVLAAEAKADSLIEKARLSEAIKIVEQIEAEVTGMVMPKRFSRTAKPSESEYNNGPITVFSQGLTEDEYKRHSLLLALSLIKNEINSAITRIKDVVLDIEATKQE